MQQKMKRRPLGGAEASFKGGKSTDLSDEVPQIDQLLKDNSVERLEKKQRQEVKEPGGCRCGR